MEQAAGDGGSLGWPDLTITPGEDAIEALRCSWRWLLGDEWSPVLFSVWGDVFLRKGGSVSWLNTGTGELSEVASSDDAFRDALSSGQVDDWFMPALVAALYRAGKRPGEGQCFSYTIFPIFAEGRYDADNIWVAPTKEHFGLSGDLHRQISALPDGGKVQMVIGQEPP